MTTWLTQALRELDSRVTDGIHVRLLWDQHEDALSVTVADIRNGKAFAVEVADHRRAMDVFHHPFAYAPTMPATSIRGTTLAAS